MKGRFIGIDVGKRTMVACFMDNQQTQLHMESYKTSVRCRKRLYRQLHAEDVVGIEAGSLTFTIAKEIQKDVGATVHVLHPAKLHFIFKSVKKTDTEDARKISRHIVMNTADVLCTICIPSDQEVENRAIAKEALYISKSRTREINRFHAIFVRNGITTMKSKDLKTKKAREKAMQNLSGLSLEEAQRLHKHVCIHEEDMKTLEEKIKDRLSNNTQAERLLSIPGVAVKTAFAFLAYVGDGSRFTSGKEVANYVGMVPRLDSSGDSEYFGRIHKRGPSILRAYFVQAAWALVRSKEGGVLKLHYEALAARRGKRIAIVATARKMLELAWTLIHKQEFYRYSSSAGRLRKIKYYKLHFEGCGV